MKNETFQRFLTDLETQLENNGLTINDIIIFLKREVSDNSRLTILLKVVSDTFIDNKPPKDLIIFRELIEIINEKVNLNIDFNLLDNRKTRIVKVFKKVTALILFLFISYIVFGGVFQNHSQIFSSTNSIVSFIFLLFLMFMLFSYEGLQISVATLKLKNLEPLKDKYKYSYKFHQEFKNKTGKFYAGRQLFVIIIVFFIAKLTSFSNYETFPFTDFRFPNWFRLIFVEYGIAGALFVLWFGQLTPQFIADKFPHGFLNFGIMKVFLKLAYFVESIELTRPGEWLSKISPTRDDISIAPEEKYRLDAEKIKGYGLLGVKKTWVISKEHSKIDHQSLYSFYQSSADQIVDPGLMVLKKHLKKHNHNFTLIRDGKHEDVFSADEINTYDMEDQWKQLLLQASPKYGSFKKGDLLKLNSIIEFSEASEDIMEILYPTKYLIFRITFEDQPDRTKDLKVCKYKRDTILDVMNLIYEIDVEISSDESNNPYAEYIDFFPEIDTHFVFKWEVNYN